MQETILAPEPPKVRPVLGLSLGVVSLAGSLLGIIPVIAGIVGLVLSVRAARVEEHKAIATAGIVISALGVAIGAGFLTIGSILIALA
jgi:hypothetical protein